MAASAAFMDQLYYQLSRGLAPAAALREVRLRMKDSADWSHPGLWSAYVATPEPLDALGATHKVEPRPVEILYQDGDRAFVRGALEEGDPVIVTGLHRIVAGQYVRLNQRVAQP